MMLSRRADGSLRCHVVQKVPPKYISLALSGQGESRAGTEMDANQRDSQCGQRFNPIQRLLLVMAASRGFSVKDRYLEL